MTSTIPSTTSRSARRPSSTHPPEPATLRRLYTDEGLTVATVAARLGVAHGTAHKWLIAAGVPMRPPVTTPRADVADDDIRRLYAIEGWTAAEIAAHLGCPTTTVYNRLQRLGVTRRPAGPRQRARPTDDELVRLYRDEGLSLRKLAERFSVSRQAVRLWLMAAGRALAREGLETPSQAARRRARERYAVLLEIAERSVTADATTTDRLRRRAASRPSP